MAPERMPRRWSRFLGAVLCFAGCSTPEERMTPAEYVGENSTVLRQLGSFVASEQQEGISRIKKLGRDQGSAVVLYVLDDPKLDDYRLEVVLARILADWQHPRAIGHLLQSLRAPDDGAVRVASEGLIAFGDHPQVISALEEMLSSPVPRDRLTAATVLKDLPGPRVTDIFLGRFKAESDPEVRAVFLLRLLRGAYRERKAFLVDALADPDRGIRGLAWTELQKVPGLPRVEFAADGPDETRAAAVATLRLWIKSASGTGDGPPTARPR